MARSVAGDIGARRILCADGLLGQSRPKLHGAGGSNPGHANTPCCGAAGSASANPRSRGAADRLAQL